MSLTEIKKIIATLIVGSSGGLRVSALDSSSSDPGSRPSRRDDCVASLNKARFSYNNEITPKLSAFELFEGRLC